MAPAGTEPWAKHTAPSPVSAGAVPPIPGLVLSPEHRVMGGGWKDRRRWKAREQLSLAATSLHSRLAVLRFPRAAEQGDSQRHLITPAAIWFPP